MTSLNTLNINMLTYELKKAKLDSIKRKCLFFGLLLNKKQSFLNTALKLINLFWKVLCFNTITAAIIKNLATTLSHENPSIYIDFFY